MSTQKIFPPSTIFLLLLVAVTSSTVCAQVFSGKLDNLNHKELVILSPRYPAYLHRDTVHANEEGYFSIRLNLKTPAYIRLWGTGFRHEEIYLTPNSNLHITADCKDSQTFWNSQYFEGSAALYNNAHIFLRQAEKTTDFRLAMETYQQPVDKFIPYMERYFTWKDSVIRAYFRDSPPTQEISDFLKIDSINRAYHHAHIRRSYLQFLPKKQQDDFYTTYIEPYALQQASDWHYTISPQYKWFFTTYIMRKVDIGNQERIENNLTPELFDQAPKLIRHYIKNEVLHQYIAETLLERISLIYSVPNESIFSNYNYSFWTEQLYLLLNIPEREDWYREKFTNLQSFHELTVPGTAALPFIVQDSTGKEYTLDDFKGKILYIDLWASWCGPCIAEFQQGKELETAFSDDSRIAFISISLDNTEQDWIGGLQRHLPPGKHYWVKGGMKSTFAVDYSITSIPHYILIDSNGKFIDYKAPRPNDTKTKAYLERLLANLQVKDEK